MQMVFIRHGEPDPAQCAARGFVGHGYDMAPLTAKGVQQAQQAAQSPLLAGAQVIVSSPYTRAMQTAAEIARETGLEIRVEIDLRELEKDLAFGCRSLEEQRALHLDFLACRGEYPPGETRRWETVSMLSARVNAVLEKYLRYDKIIVVTHGGVIRRFVKEVGIPYCKPYAVEITAPVRCMGWVD